jgi:hypothetical protein
VCTRAGGSLGQPETALGEGQMVPRGGHPDLGGGEVLHRPNWSQLGAGEGRI